MKFPSTIPRLLTLFALVCGGISKSHAQVSICENEFAIVDQGMGELEYLAVDIARRMVLAHFPKAGKAAITTLEIRVRPEGDVVHTYAKVQHERSTFCRCKRRPYVAEVWASMVYTPDVRRVYDLSYEDNSMFPLHCRNCEVQLISHANEAFERRDPLRMPAPLLNDRLDVLPPRDAEWIRNCVSGDHGWHAYKADHYPKKKWVESEQKPGGI